VVCQVFAGRVPEWPFEWPLAGYARLRQLMHADMITLLKRSLELKPSRRFEDGGMMLAAYLRAKPKVLRHYDRARRPKKVKRTTKRDWKEIRQQQILSECGRQVATTHQ